MRVCNALCLTTERVWFNSAELRANRVVVLIAMQAEQL
jgi:hypothetical protein